MFFTQNSVFRHSAQKLVLSLCFLTSGNSFATLPAASTALTSSVVFCNSDIQLGRRNARRKRQIKEHMVNRTSGKLAQIKLSKAMRALFISAAFSALFATAAGARDLAPEIASRIWVENDSEVAVVSINGKDMITFRAPATAGTAGEE